MFVKISDSLKYNAIFQEVTKFMNVYTDNLNKFPRYMHVNDFAYCSK